MKRRLLLCLMIFALMLTALAGCGKVEEEDFGVSDSVISKDEKEESDSPSKEEDPAEDPKEEDPKEEDSKEEDPKEEDPKEEEPKEEEPKEEDPKEEPKEEDPKEEAPKEEEPKEDKPVEEGPKDHDGFPLPAEGIDYTNGYIKVMSYNIKHLGSQSQNMDPLVDYLKNTNPDIVCFQEVDNGHSRSGRLDQVKVIAERCGYPYFHFGKNIDIDGGGEYGNAMVSKFPIKNAEVVNFNAVAPDDHNRSYSRYELNVDGKTLCVYNMHGTLDGTPDHRLIGAEVTQMFTAAEKDEYAVLMGDFNLQAQHMNKFLDTKKFMVLNGGLDFETFIYTFNSANPTSNIDNIMVSRNLEYYWNHQTGVGCETDKNPKISDHNPIYTWIKIPA